MRRNTFDAVLTAGGFGLTVVLVVAGAAHVGLQLRQ